MLLIEAMNSWRLLFIQTRGRKRFHLFVGDGHDGVVEFVQEVRDGLVHQERRHRRQQQVDEDERHREDVLQAGFTELHGRAALPGVVLCSGRRYQSDKWQIQTTLRKQRNQHKLCYWQY